MTTLHDTVEQLTKPTFEHVFQKHDNGRAVVQTIEIPGMLEQMRAAVMPSSNHDTGSASMKSTRSPGDLDAMYAFAKIASQIGDWCRMIGIISKRDAVTDLTAWYDKARSVMGDEEAGWYRRTLNGWVNLIRNHLEPPEAFVIHAPCPVCRATAWGDQINGGDMWPIEVRYRLDADGTRTDEVARCRAGCGTVWHGLESVTELADEINEKNLTTTGDNR